MLCTMLNRHFAHPQGLLGRLAGRMMARKNATLTHRVIAAAGLRGTETVLEIGCGPGVGLAALAAVLPHGQVLGAEPSAVMRQQAAGRLRAYGDRVHLVDATAGTPPWPAGTVDVVLAVNSVQLWQPLARSLARVREVLVPGGRLLAGLTEHAVRWDGSSALLVKVPITASSEAWPSAGRSFRGGPAWRRTRRSFARGSAAV
jgi:SAM-dependent methyltransferase